MLLAVEKRILWDEYPIADIDELSSPRLLVFRARVEANIERMRRRLEAVAPGSGFRHLCAHVKTHKSSWITRLQLERGLARFKATPNELSMLVDAGARDIFVSYPPLPAFAEELARLAAAHPDRRFSAQIACREHAAALAAAAAGRGVSIEGFIDLDVGMHRTGIACGRALDLHRDVFAGQSGSKDSPLRFAGLHAYDGHNKGATPAERRRVSEDAMGQVLDLIDAFRRRGIAVPRVVAGGSPGFLDDLELLLAATPADVDVEVSPGTWIFWDTNYDARMPGDFDVAALILARVMDHPGDDRVTLDLGHKRWAIDAGPVERFSSPGLEVVSTSEEHTVLKLRDPRLRAAELAIGRPVLIAPQHICSTVNLWERFTVIGPDGEVEIAACPVDARNR
jgi:D-serine deaminase-like pyridoxal phosphate-dependent protein